MPWWRDTGDELVSEDHAVAGPGDAPFRDDIRSGRLLSVLALDEAVAGQFKGRAEHRAVVTRPIAGRR